MFPGRSPTFFERGDSGAGQPALNFECHLVARFLVSMKIKVLLRSQQPPARSSSSSTGVPDQPLCTAITRSGCPRSLQPVLFIANATSRWVWIGKISREKSTERMLS
jgi:hypothetical protein